MTPLVIGYDYKLVLLSVSVAIISAHSGILIFSPRGGRPVEAFKTRLGWGAAVIGSGIWTMHFVGMLALRLPFAIDYSVLPTLISALVAVVMTGVGLYAATSGRLGRWGLPVGATGMGLGIAAMHYIGMSAISSVCGIGYSFAGTAMAIVCGVAASALALCRLTRPTSSWASNVQAAFALGAAISSMHYIAMLTTRFGPLYDTVMVAVPSLNATYLACFVAVAVFFFVNILLLLALPDVEGRSVSSFPKSDSLDDPAGSLFAPTQELSIPVSGNGETRFVSVDRILFVTAEGHYTRVGYVDENSVFRQQICDHSLAKLADLLTPHRLLRCHRSHLVNLGHVEAIRRRGERGEAVLDMVTAPAIPVSRTAMPNFCRAVGEYRNAV